MLNSILPFIILILVVVFVHEYGHYYFAKKYGVGVTGMIVRALGGKYAGYP